jgi:beta-glucosidase-like glycosyl hydrolase
VDLIEKYKDTNLSAQERAAAILGKMNLSEKIAQLSSIWLRVDASTGTFAPSQMSFGGSPVWDIETAVANAVGHITRLFGSEPINPDLGIKQRNELQRRIVEASRFDIPALFHEECLNGAAIAGATSFPSCLAMASTWSPDLVYEIAKQISLELQMLGINQGLAPVADLAYDARWGRVEETFGEDPYLAGNFIFQYTRGLQQREIMINGSQVIATLKALCAYSASEGGRNFAPVDIGKRKLSDIFLYPYEIAIRFANALSVMASYQEIDGELPTCSEVLLKQYLRENIGFDGFTVSDYGAITFLRTINKVAADETDTSALALKAGLNVEYPNPVEFVKGVKTALERGMITLEEVDSMVKDVLIVKFRIGLYDKPYADTSKISLRADKSIELSKKAALESIVLLKNDGTLPLSSNDDRKILLVGPCADDWLSYYGNYTFQNHVLSTHFSQLSKDYKTPSFFDYLRDQKENVIYSRGCSQQGDDVSGFAEAVDAASDSDLILAVVGDKVGHFSLGTVGEGSDVSSLKLPGMQEELILALSETKKPIVTIVVAGRPYSMDKVSKVCNAIVYAWLPAEFTPEALYQIIFGKSEPSGRLPITFPRSAGTCPKYYYIKPATGGIPLQREFPEMYSFGYGLSYTWFEYGDLNVFPQELENSLDSAVTVEFVVTNTGLRSGWEVPQIYVSDVVASVTRPIKELKAFTKVFLSPGQRAKISASIHLSSLCFMSLDYERVVEPGAFIIEVGTSSSSVKLKSKFDVTGSRQAVQKLTNYVNPVKVEIL